MDFNKFIHIGIARKTHGLNGTLDIQFVFSLKKSKSKKLKSLFIGNAEQPLPYFIEDLTLLEPEYCRVKLADINNRETAMKLCHKDVYTDEKTFREYFTETRKKETHNLAGYTLMSDAKTKIGIIEDVLDFPGQTLAQLQYKGREILIPLNAETIVNINKAQQTVTVKIPDGLLEIY